MARLLKYELRLDAKKATEELEAFMRRVFAAEQRAEQFKARIEYILAGLAPRVKL